VGVGGVAEETRKL